ncbi:MAG TPA: ferritin-like domain-containing protein [Labilithrix sp.]|nr:ferritin-like domain-containing protein [Labilithrix sp.]
MRSDRFRALVRGVVRVALASSCGAAAYACSDGSTPTTVTPGAEDGPEGGADGASEASAFADEAAFACAAPLPSVLDGLTPAMAVDYVEVREQDWTSSDDGGTRLSAPRAAATHGTACATATNAAACTTALAALSGDHGGWYTDGDTEIGRGIGGPYKKQFLVYTRGDTVSALLSTKDVAAFLGTIESLEEARLLLETMNQPLVCTTDPARSGWRKADDGSWEIMVAGRACGTLIPYRTRYRVARDGAVTVVARDPSLSNGSVCGRRPAGLVKHDTCGDHDAVTNHLVTSAYLEAASVVAFRRLELELRRFGAPPSLVARAQRSRADEIAHARDTARLARERGGVVPPLDIAPMTVHSLVEVALENAAEGCVRETYGALVAAFQAERCAPELRAFHRRIAADEARHAELAHDVARWLDRKLSPAERARVVAARAQALAELRTAALEAPDAAVARQLGVPDAVAARALIDGLDRAFLAAA